jgi:hypothetical protein
MKREPADVPPFDAPLLRDLAVALARRRRAIRNHTTGRAGWSCEQEFSELAAATSERLNLDLRLGEGLLRVNVWADGGLWVGLSVAAAGRNAGWAFQDQLHGSVLDVSPATLVAMVEATIAESFRPGESDPAEYRERLRGIWGRVGPRPV